jgi:hypothetical protein
LHEPTEPQLSLDELLRSVAYWLDHSDSDVTWPFVKRGLSNLIDDLKLTLESRSDRSTIEEDIVRIEEFIKRQDETKYGHA